MRHFILLTLSAFITTLTFAEEVTLKTKTGDLKGTLEIPTEGKKHPIVIFIAGSGPTDRDGNNPQVKNDCFKLMSAVLVENGYATLRFDKRGVAESADAAPATEEEMSFDHFVQDVVDWSMWTKKDGRFSQVIGIGHSQGSLVGMLAANSRGAFDGYISLCGPADRIHVTLKQQLGQQLEGEALDHVNEKLDSLGNGFRIKEIPEGLESIFRESIQPFLISWMKYDPRQEIAKMNIPNLIIGGSTDAQVAGEDAKILGELNDRSEVSVIKNMNHVLRFTKETSVLMQMEIYSDPELPLHPKLMKPILSFLEQFKGNN